MKIRSGFVSNSSSSSFVLAFPRIIESEADVIDILFNGERQKDVRDDWWKEYNNDAVTSDEVASYFFNNAKLITDNFFNEKDEYGDSPYGDFLGDSKKDLPGWYYYDAFMDEANNPFRIEKWEALDILGPDHAKETVDMYKKDHPGKFLYKIEVGNECGYVPSFMENSDIYKNVDIAFYTNKH